MTQEEIESYLEQTEDIADNPYSSGVKRYNPKKAMFAGLAERAKKVRRENDIQFGPALEVGSQFSSDSKYDEGITAYDVANSVNDYRADHQSTMAKIGGIAAHAATSYGSMVLDAAMLANPYTAGLWGVAALAKAADNIMSDDEKINPVSWLTDNFVSSAFGKLKEGIDEATPVYAHNEYDEGLSKYAGWAGVDALASGAGFLMGGQRSAKMLSSLMGEGSGIYKSLLKYKGGDKILQGKTISEAARGIEELALAKGIDATEDLAKLAGAKKFADSVSGMTATIASRAFESILEARGTKEEMISKGFTEEEANDAMSKNFLANMALSSVDYYQNLKMLGTFKGILGTAPVAGKYADDVIKAAATGSKLNKGLNVAKAFGKNLVLEGGEEAIQFATNKAAQDSVMMGDNGFAGNWYNFITETGKEFENSFTDTEGQLSWILGGLMGGTMSGVHAGIDFKNKKKQLANLVQETNNLKEDLDANFKVQENDIYSTYELPDGTKQKVINKDYLNTLQSNGQLEAVKQHAKETNDEPLYEAANNKQVLNKAIHAIRTGTFDEFITGIETSKNIDAEELRAYKSLQEGTPLNETEITEQDVVNHKLKSDKAIQLAKDFNKTYTDATSLTQLAGLSKEALFKFADVVASQKSIENELRQIRPELIPALEEHSDAYQAVVMPEDGKKKADGTYDMRTKENKSAAKNNALALALNTITDPIEKEKLKQDYNHYKELNVLNQDLLQQYKDYLTAPKKLEEEVNKEKTKQIADKILNIQKTNETLENYHKQLQVANKKSPSVIRAVDEDGEVFEFFTKRENGLLKLYDVNTGEEVDISELDGKEISISLTDNDLSQFEEQQEENIETKNWLQESYEALKLSFFSSTGSVWRFGKKTKENPDGKLTNQDGTEWLINEEASMKALVSYMSNAENTPGITTIKGTKAYSWKLDTSINPNKLQEIVDTVNERRLSGEEAKFTEPLTIEKLTSDPDYQLIKMTLYEDGKPVVHKGEEIVCFMHDIDYFYKTAEFDRIVNEYDDVDERRIKINEALNRISEQRKRIIDSIVSSKGAGVYVNAKDKSEGVLSLLPLINGKRQRKNIVGRLVTTFKNLLEHTSFVVDDVSGEKLVPGIGIIKNVVDIDNMTSEYTIEYTVKSGFKYQTETVIDNKGKFKKGEMIYNDISANGSKKITKPFVKGKFSEEEVKGLVNALYYFVKNQSNIIKVNGKDVELFSNFLLKQKGEKAKSGVGVIDALINIYNGDKTINVSNINGKYILKIGKVKINPETITKEELTKLVDELYTTPKSKGIYYSYKNMAINAFENGYVFPKSIDENGNAEVIESKSMLEHLFNGEDPRIGTNVTSGTDGKFINSYMTLETVDEGKLVLKTTPAKRGQTPNPVKPQPQPKPSSSKTPSSIDIEDMTEDEVLDEIFKNNKELIKNLNDQELFYILGKFLVEGVGTKENKMLENLEKSLSESKISSIFKELQIDYNDNSPILEQIAIANPNLYNEFISKIRFINKEPIKTETEVKEEECNGASGEGDIVDSPFKITDEDLPPF
jgi:hypothetical protein